MIADELNQLVQSISDDEIRRFTEQMLVAFPSAFWTNRASRNHHPPDERGTGGNLLHSVRVVKLVRILAETCKTGQLGVDILTSAASMHDGCRYGLDGAAGYTIEEHPHLIRKLAMAKGITCKYSDAIFTIIENHMGIWGDPQFLPDLTPSAILCVADTISARAEQVWGEEKIPEINWAGGVPFQDIGMTEEKMDLMGELAETNDYWETSNKFVNSMSSRRIESLTEKQQSWLHRISDSLDEELDKRGDDQLGGW